MRAHGIEQTVASTYRKLFTGDPLQVKSPGRINLIGEHTDYNNGFVMPAAIDKGVAFAIGRSDNTLATIHSAKYDETLSIDTRKPDKVSSPAWANYLIGVLARLKQEGVEVPPFNCVFHGDLPTGAGLSSSAAVECGFIFGLNTLFDLRLEREKMAYFAQWAEHNYVGVKCGIMDQFTSIMGRKDNVILLDCRSLEYDYIPFKLKDYTLVLIDTGVKHSLASSEYNTRRAECEQGVAILRTRFAEVNSLRDVSPQLMKENKSLFPDSVYQRCLYVSEENERVLKAKQLLLEGQMNGFGALMYQSHDGLSNMYAVSCPELDFLVEQAKKDTRVAGARMMGGGFGGCTINLVEREHTDSVVESIVAAYKSAFGIHAETYAVEVSDGAAII